MDPTNKNELYSITLTPWTAQNPRIGNPLIFPLTDGRLLFVYNEDYVRKPSRIFNHPYSGAHWDDHYPSRISAKVSTDRGRSWSEKIILQENCAADNTKHPNLIRLPTGKILFTFLNATFRGERKSSKCSGLC